MVIWMLLFSCKSEKEQTCPVDWRQPIPMTAVVTWTGDGKGPSELVWTDEKGVEKTEQFNTDATVNLTGLMPGHVHEYQLKGNGVSCASEFQAETLPSYFPNFQIETHHPDLMSSEGFVMGIFISFGFGYTAYVIDRDGRPYWMHREEGRMSAMVEKDAFTDGAILNSYPNDLSTDDGQIRRVDVMGSLVEVIETPLGHHAFEQLPDGTIAYPAFDIREWTDPDSGEVVLVSGDVIMEQYPDGTREEIFNSWDWLTVSKHERWDDAFLFQGAHDWTHANTLGFYPSSNSYMVSFPYIQSIVEVDRSTGVLIDEISPSTESFPETPFVFQHFPVRLENGNILLVSHADDGTAAIEYAASDEGKLAKVWSHGEGNEIIGHVLGQATRLANGNTLINYGGAGLMQEVTPDNTVVWEVYTGMGIWMGSGQVLEQWP